MAVARSCCVRGDPAAARRILRAMWSCQLRLTDRSVRALLIAAADAAAAGAPEASELLGEIREAMTGGGGRYGACQRAGARRGDVAAHETARAVAVADWRAGRLTAAEAAHRCRRSLAAAGVRPRPVLLATEAHMHAAEGNLPAALRVLRTRGPGGKPATEGAFVAVLNSIVRPAHLPDAMAVLRAMAAAHVQPTLRTRAALAALLLRLRHSQPGPAPIPSASAFWRETRIPWGEMDQMLRSFEALGVSQATVADLVLETRTAALLHQIGRLADRTAAAETISSHLARMAAGAADRFGPGTAGHRAGSGTERTRREGTHASTRVQPGEEPGALDAS